MANTTNTTNEPRALAAALSGPELVTRGAGLAMHVANRHVERWAPEAGASRVRSLRSLGFVDRMVTPWIETATRSAGLRMFTQYARTGMAEREGAAVSWVFPRPWYQDELDWMAAARQTTAMAMDTSSSSTPRTQAPAMLTTRGTYMTPQQAVPQMQMPAALYEYVAPSLSIAAPTSASAARTFDSPMAALPRSPMSAAYSPLVSLAAVQAAQVAQRMAPIAQMTSSSTGLRGVLAAFVERAVSRGTAVGVEPTRSAQYAPELETPPHPRPELFAAPAMSIAQEQVAEQVAEQRVKIAELQRVSRQIAAQTMVTPASSSSSSNEVIARASVAEAEARARTARAAEIAQRTQVDRVQRDQVAQQAATTVERARVEAQIAERVEARRRMHDDARVTAAAHAAQAPISTLPAPVAPEAAPREVPAQMLAAIAALPPELSRALASSISSSRPERVMAAIGELSESLRAAEIMARATRVPEVTRGPRMIMPVGLGGLVSTIQSSSIASQPFMSAPAMRMPTAAAMTPPPARPSERPSLRTPTMAYFAPRAATPAQASTASGSALSATTSQAPAALTHVAWADRWLARFAGATSRSLDLVSPSVGSPSARAIAQSAPGEIFVAGDWSIESAPRTRIDESGHVSTVSVARAERSTPPTLTVVAPIATTPMRRTAPERYDDNAETPDDVFASIAAAASQRRVEAVRPTVTSSASSTTPMTPSLASVPAERSTYVDQLARALPSSPNAGMSAGLAASPFAPALHHVLPITASQTFDVRSLFGTELGATYLAGLLAPASQEMSLAESTFAPRFAQAFLSDPTVNDPRVLAERVAPEFDATYVTPESPEPTTIQQMGESPSVTAPTQELERLITLRSALLSWTSDGGAYAPTAPSVTTLAPTTVASSTTSVMPEARTGGVYAAMLDAMSLPMLGDGASDAPATTMGAAPGMIGARAHAFSVATERSTADLAFDFVTPELVLAAKVYGFGPTEAIQAARLATVGPAQLATMAGAVDRTFVQAMAIEHEARRSPARFDASMPQVNVAFTPSTMTAYPAATVAAATAAATSAASAATSAGYDATASAAAATAAANAITSGASSSVAASEGAAAASASGGREAMAMRSPGTTFGIERRAPRGAFLWPSATVAALGLDAASTDGSHAMNVAALELLAAQAVAEIGTYAAISHAEGAGPMTSPASTTEPASSAPSASAPGVMPGMPGSPAVKRDPSEREVLDTVAAFVPSTRRSRFDALYVALGQSTAGREWSPAARAARALALASRGEDGITASAYERAATVWDVMPVVYANTLEGLPSFSSASSSSSSSSSSPASSSAPSSSSARRPGSGRSTSSRNIESGISNEFVTGVDARPGLSTLSARAGEALGSYVSTAASSAAMGSDASVGADVVEYQRSISRPSAKAGGGEAEIPAWFEAAARRMFEQQTGVSDGISLKDLTLVAAAPPSQVAASTRGESHSTPAQTQQPASSAAGVGNQDIDIEKLAYEVYRQILELMDTARSRNGEYL